MWYKLSMAKLSENLRERGYVYQFSSKTLEEITDGPKRTVYFGIDPSADSLHVGNLMGLLVLRRFLEDGHQVVILTGGGTGMIGDPGGKSSERNLLDAAAVGRNAAAVASQIRRVFGGGDFAEVNNADWLEKLPLIEFLRDTGKHFTVNAMVKKEMVRERLEKESPLSFTEFSYSLLQAYDFWHLFKTRGCDVQVGGSDQWGNILAGVEFIRRKEEKEAYALTWPLIVNKATGKKFGKSEDGAIWLDAAKTSPYRMYQFLLGSEDDAAEEYLLKLTLLTKTEIEAAMTLHKRRPRERHAQRLLAREVTSIVHGREEAERAEAVSQVLFGEASLEALDRAGAAALRAAAPVFPVRENDDLADVLVGSGLASSKREARQFIADGAVSMSGSVAPEKRAVEARDFRHGVALLKRGKRSVCVLVLRDA